MRVVDAACGAGILLAAVSLTACGSDKILANDWLRHCVHAADLSPLALRGTLLSLAALTDDLDALADMRAKWRVQDSLLAAGDTWEALAPEGFDLVIANPPWERSSYPVTNTSRPMGTAATTAQATRRTHFTATRRRKLKKRCWHPGWSRSTRLSRRASRIFRCRLYGTAAQLDLRPGGSGALLVPAGLIRSLNTQHLRQELIDFSKELSFTVMENRARHFAIDTRFNFLLVNYVKSTNTGQGSKKINITHATADDASVSSLPPVSLPRLGVAKASP